MTLAFKKLSPNAIIPARATTRSAGLDIRALINEISQPVCPKTRWTSHRLPTRTTKKLCNASSRP